MRLCSSAEAGIVLNLFLNLGQKWASCSYSVSQKHVDVAHDQR